ncbi:hypothetical protein OAG12_01830 [Akkermansiaceae bacterium]|nr:hypothetical protein [Akkermansiaceae bacterium]
MIEASYDIIDEVHILGGTAALLKVRLWEPNQEKPEFKFKIAASNYDQEFIKDWEFASEEAAIEAFNNLSQNVA